MRIFLIFFVGAIVLVLLGGVIYLVSSGSSFDFFKKNNASISRDDSFNTLVPGKLMVLTNTPFEPMEYISESGELIGFDIDLIKAIGKKLGLEVTIEQKDWDLMFELVKQRKVDLAISGITITQERGREFNFSIPYLSAGQVILVKEKNPLNIIGPADLEGKRILVQKNTTGALIAKESKGVVIELDEINDGVIQDLVLNNADAIVIDYVVGSQFVKKYKELKLIEAQLSEEYYGILFPLSENKLISAMDSVIREMKTNGELDAIRKRWLE